jgi:16S rRNA processing protein RimM
MLTDISAYYPVGFIAKTTGPKGEVIIRFEVAEGSLSKKIRSFFILINKKPVPLAVATYSLSTDNTAIVHFMDYNSKEEVRELIGHEVFLPDENIIKKPAGMDDLYSLKGFRLENEKKKFIGTITGFQDNKGNYLLEIITENNSEPILIPLHEDLIKGIYPDKKIIRLVIAEGLLEL